MLKDKVVVITGGASGIGRATALLLAQAGASVVVGDWDAAGAAETVAMIGAADEEHRHRAVAVEVDVADEDGVRDMVELAVKEFGRLDGAFNNAGVWSPPFAADALPTAEWSRVIAINLTGVFLCLKYQIAAMRKTGGGAIVITSSGNGIIGSPNALAYVASKHGAIGAMRAAAAEAGQTGVRVNAVLPAVVDTPMVASAISAGLPDHIVERHSVGRIAQPEDVGYAVKWLLSDEAAYINGAAIPVDGGYSAR